MAKTTKTGKPVTGTNVKPAQAGVKTTGAKGTNVKGTNPANESAWSNRSASAQGGSNYSYDKDDNC